ncbi:ABC-type transport system substrate-binding protein [Chitinivorax tropicus]|uniref:ABC-type transport system substrate-binding protein n=1 Tax=Chitinivorax tropicus TaxID=714531 RepID=A0A840MNU6_9PROT|nr:ABC transporter substrate-binding protein [Chitinivorax tropicus]MBB5020110.1 ABC-type transport system substrate-binding protein [Chitinivorax tropicus]
MNTSIRSTRISGSGNRTTWQRLSWTLLNSFTVAALGMAACNVAVSADMNKTLHFGLEVPETGFDPAEYSDQYSNIIMAQMFESMLTFDYLSRPARVVPQTAEAMPVVSEDGRTYTIRLKKGIYFADDPAFNGVKRELTAQDYVFSLQRLVDPTTKRPNSWLLRGKIVGLDEKLEAAKAAGSFDPSTPVEGLKALDRYTLQIKLTKPDYNLNYILAMTTTGALAKEVVDKYGKVDIGAHPVGTGPYILQKWERGHRTSLVASPSYRGMVYEPPVDATGVNQTVMAELRGKRLPLIGRIDLPVMENGQAQWLGFLRGDTDIHYRVGSEYALQSAPGGKLKPQYAKKGIKVFRELEPEVTFNQFNMEDEVVGGYEPEKVALRRALAMSYNSKKEAMVTRAGQAIEAEAPWGPGIVGYDPNFKNALHAYNPARANAILDTYGYKDVDGDGYRELPNGKPLEITYLGTTTGGRRDFEELMEQAFKAVKIRLRTEKTSFPDQIQRKQNGKFQLTGGAWGADFPDVENFLQLLYGPNCREGNDSCFKLKEYDDLYREISQMPDSPERQAKVMRMVRLVAAYAPWNFNVHRIRTHMEHSWTTGFLAHPVDHVKFMYYDIDLAKREAYKKQQ